MAEVRAAGFVIFRRVLNQIQYLLLQASYGAHHWTPPKGHVDPGESDIETAFRETQEEAGLKKSDLNVIDGFKKVTHYNVRGRPKVVVYWIAELVNNAPIILSREHQSFEWVPLEKACALADFQEMQEVLQECNSFLVANCKK